MVSRCLLTLTVRQVAQAAAARNRRRQALFTAVMQDKRCISEKSGTSIKA
ncbi:hypothetical protein VG539_000893 [Cronobacter muytjensii]|nr:hypothetical protein [Cronobacter muytjensii]MDI6454187.1 hypothetical protein [Cronobacter muytjensii]